MGLTTGTTSVPGACRAGLAGRVGVPICSASGGGVLGPGVGVATGVGPNVLSTTWFGS